mgnify:CR=1 FL=1
MTIELRSCNLAEMEQVVKELGQPAFRAKQLFQWVHQKGVSQVAQMKNLGKDFQQALAEHCVLDNVHLVRKQVSKDGTEKFLLSLRDGEYIECVLMRYRGEQSKQRNTLCVSSQVGCAMGCTFCATGLGGWVRNLTAGEILGQVYVVNEELAKMGDDFSIGNVVFMGMGEPLLNMEQVLKAIALLHDEKGQNIGMRRITLSTCGIAPKILELAQRQKDLVLAISLHAPNDALRSQMMPINKTYNLAQLMAACRSYEQLTKKRISFEYALIKGVNDQPEHVKELKELLKGLDCHLNIIPVNPVIENTGYVKPDYKHIQAFVAQLTRAGLNASIREEKGADIDGACGQLRGKEVGPRP